MNATLRNDRSSPVTNEEPICAEGGCEERVMPGSSFCIWHPKLRLADRLD